MKILVSLFLIIFAASLYAGEPLSIDSKESVFKISDCLKRLPATKQSFEFNPIDNEFYYTISLEIAKYKNFMFDFGCGFTNNQEIAKESLFLGISYNLIGFQQMGIDIPILNLINLSPGVSANVFNIGTGNGLKIRPCFSCSFIKVKI